MKEKIRELMARLDGGWKPSSEEVKEFFGEDSRSGVLMPIWRALYRGEYRSVLSSLEYVLQEMARNAEVHDARNAAFTRSHRDQAGSWLADATSRDDGDPLPWGRDRD